MLFFPWGKKLLSILQSSDPASSAKTSCHLHQQVVTVPEFSKLAAPTLLTVTSWALSRRLWFMWRHLGVAGDWDAGAVIKT